jgi:CRP/FNR family transcriptional regulator, cyclic AMP receptor protein
LRIMRTMAARIRLLDLTLESDRAFSLGPRLARVIVRLLPPNGQGRLRLDLSQGDLGAFAGISRENVNRQLGEWEFSGLLQRTGRKIDVLNPGFFRELADFGEDD